MNLRDLFSLLLKSLLIPDPGCFAVFIQLCLRFCRIFFYLAHFQGFVYSIMNLSLRNNTCENAAPSIRVRIGGNII